MKPKKKKENRGGVRPGAGAKKLGDLKEQVFLYVEGSKIEALGGKKRVQEICYALINSMQPEVITQPSAEPPAFAAPQYSDENIGATNGSSL